MFRKPAPKIRLLGEPGDEGVIAPPVPAKTYIPDWFRRLPAVDESKVSPTDTGLTIKRCMPFLDAMNTGWIIPLPATVRLKVSNGGRDVPFRRDSAKIPAEIRAETPEEAADRTSVPRNTRASPGWYRTEARAKR
jgi:hypothetical protein